MVRCQLDHLVVGAATLEAGVAYIERTFGVHMPFGGAHPLMGTHNCLMRIGDACFLEIIAIDPNAPNPRRPRWFTLDDESTRMRISQRPRLLTWVVRTDDIEAAVAASPVAPGPIEEGRRGDMVWQITIPEDGSMPEGGLFPTLIQWPDTLRPDGPAPNMTDLGCRLTSLAITHSEPERLGAALASIGAGHLTEVTGADISTDTALAAHFTTPLGNVTLT